MNKKLISLLLITAFIVSVAAGITYVKSRQISMQSFNNNTQQTSQGTENGEVTQISTHEYAKNLIKPKDGQPVKKFSLTVQEVNLEIKQGVKMPVWTYNGTVPGQEIRVTQGDFVQVELKNTLKEPVTIHWHGYPVISAMDGIPGLQQDAVRPGETFTYEFSADFPGTYWYHSHQESSKHVDKGLYGALIVEPKNKGKIDKDYTLILDEWMEKPMDMESMGGDSSTSEGGHSGMDMSSSNDQSGMEGMDMSGSSGGHEGMNMQSSAPSDPVMEEEDMMAYAYDIYTVNGKSAELIKPLDVNKGDVVRLRFINAGYRSHGIHIPGQDIKIVSTDGQDIVGASIIKDQVVLIGPGERYDIEFTVTSDDNFVIDAHDENGYNDQIKIPVNVVDGSGNVLIEDETIEYPIFDLLNYGTPGVGKFTLNEKFDIEYSAELNTKVEGTTVKYTIGGKTYEEATPLKVSTGKKVKVTYKNSSIINHPMHLHGHFFQVLSRNGVPVAGAPIMKDTLLVKPGEEYVVAFIADNPGNWVQHCHELHHASAGMMQKIEYTDFKSAYTTDPKNTFNKPE